MSRPLLCVSLCVICAVLPAVCLVSPAVAQGDLAAGFAAPPADARPWVYWFWLNGNITKEGITADLEAMQRVGIGGVLIMEVDQGAPVGPVDFAGDRWRELFKHVVLEAHRLGLEVNMNDDAGWNGSGGPWITPDKAMQKVVWSETEAQGPARFEAVLPQPQVVAGYYRDIRVLAFPSCGAFRLEEIAGKSALVRQDRGSPAQYPQAAPGDVVSSGSIRDLTSRLDADGRLTWDVPAGKWTILRLGHTPTGAQNAPAPATGRGLECDKLSKEGSQAAFLGFIGKLAEDNKRLCQRSFVATHIDSWENGSQNWTATMPEEFRRLRGYDIVPFLPVFTGRVVDSIEVSERFLYDLRQTVSDLLVENYAGHMRRLAHKHGLRLTIEAYGDTTVDDLAYAGHCDEPMGEFWSWPGLGAEGSLTEMSSAAHVYGRPIVGAEAFTANDGERWQHHPGSIKGMGDRAFCMGINRFVFHRYALQPWLNVQPGMSMGPWGLHYERTQTWWEQSGPWHEYLARCQYLLRQGLPVVDILCLAPEGAPRAYNPPPSLTRTGYKADACPTDALLKRARVLNGRIAFPDGMSYRVLQLPGAETMTPALLKHIWRLVSGGATVVGTPPRKAPGLTDYPECDAEVAMLAKALWDSGRIATGKGADQVLAAKGIPPDFTADRMLDFIHRRVGDTDLYFVANSLSHGVNATCSFRVSGKRPELWDPMTGRREPAAIYTEAGGVTRMPIRLEPAGSVFVVFRPGPPVGDPVVRLSKDGQPIWPAERPKAKVTIRRAIWTPTQPGRQTWDVTQHVQRLVDRGTTFFMVRDLAAIGDPAHNIVKTLRVEYEVGGQVLRTQATDPQRINLQAPAGAGKITIRRAVWGPAADRVYEPKDVTAQVQRKVDGGVTSFVVAELVSEGDPAPMILKRLTVDYEIEGRRLTASATDPELIVLEQIADDPWPVRLQRRWDGRLVAVAAKQGAYELETKSGPVLRFSGLAAQETRVLSPWQIAFDPRLGGPPSGGDETTRFPQLVSWSDSPDPRIRYYSGPATYSTSFQLPASQVAKGRRLTLDLGRVEVMAHVYLNGRDLGLLWKAPYRVDITGTAKPGENSLRVQVTNLWPNRMIGDEELPEDSKRHGNGTLQEWPQWVLDGETSPTGRITFTSWRLWHKGEALLPSGLLGPVTVTSEQVLAVAG